MNKNANCNTFCLLKTEAVILNKNEYILSRILDSELDIVEVTKVRMSMSDIFLMYKSCRPVLAMILRMPYFFDLPVYFLSGEKAIEKMHKLKYKIRKELWGFKNDKGGFLHAPDSDIEYRNHRLILSKRIVT